MTRAQFRKKIGSMQEDITNYISKEAIRLFDSGAIDRTQYSNDYLLPKIVLTVVLDSLSRQHMPLSEVALNEIRNLKHF